LHSGQDQQCSHCLKTGRGGCRALGNGKACEQLKTPRAKMADYMADLKRTIGYESLKSQYLRQFPSLGAENMSNMEETQNGEDDDEEDLLPTNPIERRDAKIVELEKNVAAMPALQENLLKMRAQLHLAVKTTNIAQNKLKFARKVTEERLKECLPVPSFVNEHSKVLITLMSTFMDEESFEIDPDTDSLKPREDFLKDIEDSIGKDSEGQLVKERFEDVKNKLVERVKESVAKNRERKMSTSSIGSISSQAGKRKNSTELVNVKESVRSKPSNVSVIH
jgi:hypothetical protein